MIDNSKMMIGEHFTYRGIEWICLDIIDGNYLAITAQVWQKLPFDVDCYNDWKESSLRKTLNKEFLSKLVKKHLVIQSTDLIADNGDVSHDLYSPKAEVYVFGYNDAGSIATYHITEKDAMELSALANKNDDYWSSFLGPGGEIWDDPSYENYSEGETTNLDRCEELLEFGDWVDTRNFNKSSGVVM